MSSQRAVLAAMWLIATSVGCARVTTPMPDPNGQTHWLMRCDGDDECGDLSCTCGVCALPCASTMDCNDHVTGAMCSPATAASNLELCRGVTAKAMCLLRCDRTGDCSNDQHCVEGACIPDAVGTEHKPDGTDAAVARDASLPSQPEDAAVIDIDSGRAPGMTSPECNSPIPALLPEVPSINVDATGRPMFDLWRDVSCGSSTEPALCDSPEAAQGDCGVCIGNPGSTSDAGVSGSDAGYVGGEGVCASSDVDVWCDGEGEVIGMAPGCFMCAPIDVHARACCEGFDIDCRAWPYPATSTRGMVCARHEDCAPGLICGAPDVTNPDTTGYGLCRCPEEVGVPFDKARCEGRFHYR